MFSIPPLFSKNRTRALLYMGPHFLGYVWQVSLPYKRTKERTFMTLPTGAEVLTQAFSPARCLRGDRLKGAACLKRDGVIISLKRQWPDAGISAHAWHSSTLSPRAGLFQLTPLPASFQNLTAFRPSSA